MGCDYRHEASFGSYLKRIALNACRDELRRRKRCPEARLNDTNAEAASFVDVSTASIPTPDAIAASRERAEHVLHAFSQLPKDYREVVILRHYAR
ncbi:MAG: hypothetical protein JSW47_10840, partial [Phycisphaerales bacterium]